MTRARILSKKRWIVHSVTQSQLMHDGPKFALIFYLVCFDPILIKAIRMMSKERKQILKECFTEDDDL